MGTSSVGDWNSAGALCFFAKAVHARGLGLMTDLGTDGGAQGVTSWGKVWAQIWAREGRKLGQEMGIKNETAKPGL